MSSAEEQLPPEERREPIRIQDDEVAKVEDEDPDFAVIQARARAKARGEAYNPAIHGPFERKLAPRIQRQAEEANKVGNIQDVINRFMTRIRPQPRLKLEPRERKDLA